MTSSRDPGRRPHRLLGVLTVCAALLAAAACDAGTGTRGAASTSGSASSTASTQGTAGATTGAVSTPATRSSVTTSASSTTPTSTSRTSATAPAPTCADRLVAGLTPAERAGQLLMVGLHPSGSSRELAAQVHAQRLGGVIYLGGWEGAAAVRTVSTRLQAAAAPTPRGRLGLLVAADQEGGQVQQLRGQGFSTIPSARIQATLGPTGLEKSARAWSLELRQAGVNVNLAPVADTVPTSLGSGNAPIGQYHRDFVPGDPAANARYAAAFVRGSRAAHVAPTLKHFPGLGRVRSNPDVSATGITDSTMSATDPYLGPFREGIAAGAPLVMLSSAHYPGLDAQNQAMFSKAIVTTLLRGRLGFDGVAITDDVGAARAVADVPIGQRATRFIAAGGDIVLTVNAGQAPAMLAAITARAAQSPAFAAQVRAAATRVVGLKTRLGVASCAS